MGIKFSDIIALAKSGYSVADVKELMQLSETPSNDAPEAQQDEEEPASEDPEEEKEEEHDYKKLYEEEAEKVRKMQRENINKNAQQPKEKTDQEILMDMARDFM